MGHVQTIGGRSSEVDRCTVQRAAGLGPRRDCCINIYLEVKESGKRELN